MSIPPLPAVPVKEPLPISAIMTYGAIGVSALACVAFGGAILIAYLSRDQTNLGMLMGVVAGAFNTVVAFWLGSSAGSQKKDETKQ